MPQNKRLVVQAVDELAQSHPNQCCFSIPEDDDDLSKGFSTVNCKQFANAINHAATWLKSAIGPSDTTPPQVLGYSGPNDLRYPILAAAVAKVGRQIIFPSSLAPPLVKLHLLNTSRCEYFLHPAQASEEVQNLLSDSPQVHSLTIPDLSVWLNDVEAPAFPYTKTYDEGKDDPWLIFHTSGTTGLPKPITYSQYMMTSCDVFRPLIEAEPRERTQIGWMIGESCWSAAPLSHITGALCSLQAPFFLDSTLVIGPPMKPPFPDVASEIIKYSGTTRILAMPSVLRAMVRHPHHLESLKKLECVAWGGAALDNETGSILSKFTSLSPAYGATETGPFFVYTQQDQNNWMYYSFMDGQGCEFVERGDDLYEMVIRKDSNAVWQSVFGAFPDRDVYETKDLFRKHPTEDGLWLPAGRSDDIVVLSNGSNINASVVEEKLMAHPNIQVALIGGSGFNRSFAILELTSDAVEEMRKKGRDNALDIVWPAIEEVNKAQSDNTRIRREFVLFADRENPLVLNAKGGLVRGESLKKFETDINALFAAYS